MSGSDYQSFAGRLHAKAKATHETWVKGLTPKQRENLRRLGVLDAAEDKHEVGGHAPNQQADAAESHHARTEIDIARHVDGDEGEIADLFDVPLSTARAILAWHQQRLEAALATHEADLLSVVVGGLLASKNVKIACAGLAFATDMAAANALGSQADYARLLGVSRTILSKSVKAWKRDLNLRTTPWQKSDEACATYSTVTKARHWRKQKVSAVELVKRLRHLTSRKTTS